LRFNGIAGSVSPGNKTPMLPNIRYAGNGWRGFAKMRGCCIHPAVFFNNSRILTALQHL
jgi:hypothetical protein